MAGTARDAWAWPDANDFVATCIGVAGSEQAGRLDDRAKVRCSYVSIQH